MSPTPDSMALAEERVKSWVVHQQLESPLYAKLPLEIRLAIFQMALGPHCDDPLTHDFRVRNDHADPLADGAMSESVASAQFTDRDSGEETGDDEPGSEAGMSGSESGADTDESSTPFLSWDLDDEESDDGSFTCDLTYSADDSRANPRQWARPDIVGVETLSTTLLRTCRRTYLEARGGGIIPDPVFRTWIGAHPVTTEFDGDAFTSAQDFFRGLTADQRNSVVTARVVIAHGLLIAGPRRLEPVCLMHAFRRIEHLRMTLCHGTANPASADPFEHLGFDGDAHNVGRTAGFGRGPPPPESPDVDWAPPVEWHEHCWAILFRYMPRLQTLVIDFDASEANKADVAARVDWAVRVWRFPLWSPRPDGCTYLSAAGNAVKKSSWRGCPGHFDARCPHCGRYFVIPAHSVVCMCPYSDERAEMVERGLGPRMYTWTVTWTPRVGRPWVAPFEEAGLRPNGRWLWEADSSSWSI